MYLSVCHEQNVNHSFKFQVLILIVMDVPLGGFLFTLNCTVLWGLNPYCNGCTSRWTDFVAQELKGKSVLILIVMDVPLGVVYYRDNKDCANAVLILIVMDVPLGAGYRAFLLTFKTVLILIVMDVPLGVKP